MFLSFSTTADTNVVLFRSAPSLTDAQVTAIERALDSGWSVDRHESFDKTQTLLVSPPDPSDQDAAFYVEAGTMGFILSAMTNDELDACGCFDSVETLVSAIQSMP